MAASLVNSPSSDKRFWSALGNRVESLLEERELRQPTRQSSSSSSSPSNGRVDSERGKRFRENSLLLIRGFDSVASSLSQLTDTLDSTAQVAGDLAKPSLDVLERVSDRAEEDEEIEPRSKRQCGTNEFPEKQEVPVGKEEIPSPKDGTKEKEVKDDKQISPDTTKNVNMKKAKDLAVSMATKAASLARELKSIKSELGFMQERCVLLEEENKRLRDGFGKGPDEDDLVRLQLEALLAEKSRLANENATLTRENQCLQQLVEYHQLTSQDLSASYDQAIHGTYLDFSSPTVEEEDDEENV